MEKLHKQYILEFSSTLPQALNIPKNQIKHTLENTGLLISSKTSKISLYDLNGATKCFSEEIMSDEVFSKKADNKFQHKYER